MLEIRDSLEHGPGVPRAELGHCLQVHHCDQSLKSLDRLGLFLCMLRWGQVRVAETRGEAGASGAAVRFCNFGCHVWPCSHFEEVFRFRGCQELE